MIWLGWLKDESITHVTVLYISSKHIQLNLPTPELTEIMCKPNIRFSPTIVNIGELNLSKPNTALFRTKVLVWKEFSKFYLSKPTTSLFRTKVLVWKEFSKFNLSKPNTSLFQSKVLVWKEFSLDRLNYITKMIKVSQSDKQSKIIQHKTHE